ncbi:MAG: aminomethyl-transferring glycine dehydrogenase subunit GcvPA [Planctomycetaceae bacterium]|nr:aminomethyl-transferring glycine dehydrogenase subunit GcvPA [Planctomycetaceae bacterium]
MSYLLNNRQDQQAMLEAIGVQSLAELLACVPAALRLHRPLELPAAMSELELTQHLETLAARNTSAGQSAGQALCFLGGGNYDHFIPAVVDSLAERGEFYTSYTPYQPEVSQGNLQVMFEYQTLICQLTGMDVSNASLYDGGSATIEAALLCMSATRRTGKVVTAACVHPEYRQVMQTYLANLNTQLVTLAVPDGRVALPSLAAALDDQVACVVLQHPNFFGCLEEVSAVSDMVHAAGALLVLVFDPLSLGILKRPAELGADVAVAEGQVLGSPMQCGGSGLGILACREQYLRRLPGRLAGQTVDRRGRRCWVLTLQTREQHIRRDKATSNICTNQGLLALRAAIYLSCLGPHGLREVSERCAWKAHYCSACLTACQRFERRFAPPVFKEFVIRDRRGEVPQLLAQATQAGILAGVPLAPWYPELADCFLVAVTEKRTRSDIDRLSACLAGTLKTPGASHA